MRHSVYRQTSGIPMGFSAPLIAIFTLAYQEIANLERLANAILQPDGALIDAPKGPRTLDVATRCRQIRLVATFA